MLDVEMAYSLRRGSKPRSCAAIVSDEATVFGSADKYLLAQLNAAGGVPPGKRLALPVGLQGDFPVRRVEVLHALSYARVRLYKDYFHDMYMQSGVCCATWVLLSTGRARTRRSPDLGVERSGMYCGRRQRRRSTSEGTRPGFGAVRARRSVPACARAVSIHGVPWNWCQRTAGSGGSQGFPASASRMASSAVMPWAAAESR